MVSLATVMKKTQAHNEPQARRPLKDPFTLKERCEMAAAHKRYLDQGGYTIAELSELARKELESKSLPVPPRK